MLRPTIYMPSRLIKLLEESRADGCTRPRLWRLCPDSLYVAESAVRLSTSLEAGSVVPAVPLHRPSALRSRSADACAAIP